MKRITYVITLMAILTFASADEGNYASILKDGGFSPSEQKVIISIFEDTQAKGLYTEDILLALKESVLKKESYFDTVAGLMDQMEIQTAVKGSLFPYLADPLMRKTAYYFIRLYTFDQFSQISREFKDGDLKKNEIQDFFQFALFLQSAGVLQNDSFTLVYLLMRNKDTGPEGLAAVKKLFLRSKDLKLSREQIVSEMKKQLMKKNPLKKTVYDIENSVR